MFSHGDKARLWYDKQGFYCDDCKDGSCGCCESILGDLADEFQSLLPEGSVAVDRELLRGALVDWDFDDDGNQTGSCVWWHCRFRFQHGREQEPHSPGVCPLGGDDGD